MFIVFAYAFQTLNMALWVVECEVIVISTYTPMLLNILLTAQGRMRNDRCFRWNEAKTFAIRLRRGTGWPESWPQSQLCAYVESLTVVCALAVHYYPSQHLRNSRKTSAWFICTHLTYHVIFSFEAVRPKDLLSSDKRSSLINAWAFNCLLQDIFCEKRKFLKV